MNERGQGAGWTPPPPTPAQMESRRRARQTGITAGAVIALVVVVAAVVSFARGPSAAEKKHQRDSDTCYSALALYINEGHPLSKAEQVDYYGACIDRLASQP